MDRRLHFRLELLEPRAVPSAMSHFHTLMPTAPSGLDVTLTTDRSVYHVGQPVQMTLTETNTSTRNVSVTIGPSIDGFYVTHKGVTVEQSNGGIQPMFVVLQTLAPGESYTLSATWNGQTLGPHSISPTGLFQVHSQVAGANTVTIRIRP